LKVISIRDFEEITFNYGE